MNFIAECQILSQMQLAQCIWQLRSSSAFVQFITFVPFVHFIWMIDAILYPLCVLRFSVQFLKSFEWTSIDLPFFRISLYISFRHTHTHRQNKCRQTHDIHGDLIFVVYSVAIFSVRNFSFRNAPNSFHIQSLFDEARVFVVSMFSV